MERFGYLRNKTVLLFGDSQDRYTIDLLLSTVGRHAFLARMYHDHLSPARFISTGRGS